MRDGPGRGNAAGADQSIILEFIRARLNPSGCGLLLAVDDLPGDEQDLALSGSRGLRWAPGARDGFASHHVGAEVSDADIGELVTLIGRAISSRSDSAEFGRLYVRLRAETTLAI